MKADPSLTNLALLLGLSLFFGLAFEEVGAHSEEKGPGGVRTFPLLGIVGALLYLVGGDGALPFTAGLVVLGAFLLTFYHHHIDVTDGEGRPKVSLALICCNILAYLLGPVVLTQPHWIAVGATVTAVLVFTERDKLHDLARRLEFSEVVTAGKFLILTGIILPLLPSEPVTRFTAITPHQVWLAVLAVCTLSYVSYLVQRYVAPRGSALCVAILGGLYSSTATTVVLARDAAGADGATLREAETGIILATSIMYLRLLAIIAVFNLPLAEGLAVRLGGLFLTGLVLAAASWRFSPTPERIPEHSAPPPHNPLELTAALVFACLFVVISIVSTWVRGEFGEIGIYSLAAIVGFTDIDPFVLSLAQGADLPLSAGAGATAVLIAIASNNVLKAVYTASFAGGGRTMRATATLILLAALGAGLTLW